MKRLLLGSLLSLFVFIFPLGLMAENYLREADALYNQGGIENYKRSIELYLKALKANPNDFEANWKCARAHMDYAEEVKKENIQEWKDICAKYGKEGMKYAQKAIKQGPNKPDGYYYYGLNAGIYSDAVSILFALKEGLKSKTQSSFEKAYELNKMYDHAGPVLALARFWAIIPWPFGDNKKALKYYREYQATRYFAEGDKGKIYLAELLLELGAKENEAEAKALLEKAAQSDDKYLSGLANKILEEIN